MRRLLLVLALAATTLTGCDYVSNVKCPAGYRAYIENDRNQASDIAVCFRTEDGRVPVNGR